MFVKCSILNLTHTIYVINYSLKSSIVSPECKYSKNNYTVIDSYKLQVTCLAREYVYIIEVFLPTYYCFLLLNNKLNTILHI